MTTDQLSLVQGDVLSQYRFTICALLEEQLHLLRSGLTSSGPVSSNDVAQAVDLVQQLAAELRQLPGEEDVPF